MATALLVQIDDASAQQLLQRYGVLGVDAAKPSAIASRIMRDKVIETFRTETDPFGHPWPPHAPSTIKARQRKGNTRASLLVDTAAMFDSTDNTSDATSATVSMDGPAEVHQFGATNAGRGHTTVIPPRPMFPIDDRGPPDTWWDAVSSPFLNALDGASA